MKQAIKEAAARLLLSLPSKSLSPAAQEGRVGNPGNPHHNDSFYFYGGGPGGAFFTRLGFRTSAETERWFHIYHPAWGTVTLADGGPTPSDLIRAGSLEYACLEPNRRWRIQYEGPLQISPLGGAPPSVQTGRLDLEYTACMPVFDFKRHGDRGPMADAMAAQVWTRSWWSDLSDLKQVHYEQAGRWNGSLQIGDRREDISFSGIRDHSYGTRRWDAMNRHLWLAGIFADGRAFNLSLVDYRFLTGMLAGFYFDGKKTRPVVSGPSWVGDGGALPKEIRFTLKPRGHEPIEICGDLGESPEFLMGGCYRFRETLARWTVGGGEAWGIAEQGWRSA